MYELIYHDGGRRIVKKKSLTLLRVNIYNMFMRKTEARAVYQGRAIARAWYDPTQEPAWNWFIDEQ